MSLRSGGGGLVLAGVVVGLALGGLGCLSDDTAVTARTPDAGIGDGGGTMDATSSVRDGGADAAPDTGTEAGPAQAGLVAGGTVAHSPNYKMTITSGPATAPVLRSPNYQLVGGVAVSGN